LKPILVVQELWRRRIVVLVALLMSICAGTFVVYRVSAGLPPHLKSRQYQVGVASARVLVDTHDSIVADLNPRGAASLSLHAQLLAGLVASESIRTAIAQSVGISPQSLAVIPPAIGGPPAVPTPVATAVPPPSGASTLTIAVDATLPLVSISAQAPSQEAAAKLANGTVTALQSYLLSVASAQKIPASRQPVISSLGVQSASATRGPSRIYGVAAALGLFSLLCYIIIVGGGVRQRARTRDLAEPDVVPAVAQPVALPEPAISQLSSNGNHRSQEREPRQRSSKRATVSELVDDLKRASELEDADEETPDAHPARRAMGSSRISQLLGRK
jgi:hypothetical protein